MASAGRLIGAAVLGLTALLSACTGDPAQPPTGDDRLDPRVQGRVLAVVQHGSALSLFRLPSGEQVPIEISSSTSSVLDARWRGEGESIVALLRDRSGEARVHEVSEAAAPSPLGPPLPGRFFDGYTDLRGDTFMAASCEEGQSSVRLLDLARGGAWTTALEGPGLCTAALSPDGAELAYSPDQRSMWTAPVDGSAPASLLLRFAAIPDLPRRDAQAAVLAGVPVWSQSGVAFGVSMNGRFAAVVVRPDGSVFTRTLGDGGSGFALSYAWAREGERLAVTSRTQVEGILRVMEPETGESRVVGVTEYQYVGPQWDPTGEVVMAAARDAWIFVDSQGTWLRTLRVGQSVPTGWAP